MQSKLAVTLLIAYAGLLSIMVEAAAAAPSPTPTCDPMTYNLVQAALQKICFGEILDQDSRSYWRVDG